MKLVYISTLGMLLNLACSVNTSKPTNTETQAAPGPSITPSPSPNPSSTTTKVYSCSMKRENTDVLCSSYTITENLVADLKKSCEYPSQNDGLTHSWTEGDCSDRYKTYNKCEIPSGTNGVFTIIYGGIKEGCTSGTFTAGTASATTLTNQTGAVPGSAESLACLADLVSKVTGTWQPVVAPDYSYFEMRSYTMAASDPDKYFRLNFGYKGTGTEIYFVKAETACSKTDNTYKLFQSALAGNKVFNLIVKNDSTLNVDFDTDTTVQTKNKFNFDVNNRKPVM